MPSKYPRAGRVVAELVRDDDGARPISNRFWDTRPSSPEVTRLPSAATVIVDAQLFAEGTLDTVYPSTREPTADLE